MELTNWNFTSVHYQNNFLSIKHKTNICLLFMTNMKLYLSSTKQKAKHYAINVIVSMLEFLNLQHICRVWRVHFFNKSSASQWIKTVPFSFSIFSFILMSQILNKNLIKDKRITEDEVFNRSRIQGYWWWHVNYWCWHVN